MLQGRLRLPLIAAPMTDVSSVELVAAACRSGVIGAFPTVNAKGDLDAWLSKLNDDLSHVPLGQRAPWAANLIVNRSAEKVEAEVAVLVRHDVEMVITSVGAPNRVVVPLHEAGCLVYSDVATLRHAQHAIAAGVDGLVLLSAGAGGQTGWLNGFAFVRAVRAFWDGPLVLAGGVSDGAALWAAYALGCDLAYFGTRFIASQESSASPAYKQALIAASADDVVTTRACTGIPCTFIRQSLVDVGINPDALDEATTPERAKALFRKSTESWEDSSTFRAWRDTFSAGHSVSGVRSIQSVAEIIAQTVSEFEAARTRSVRDMAFIGSSA